MNMEFELAGVEQFVASMDHLSAEISSVVAKALNSAAERTMTRSKSDYCPVDTGNLKSSGYVRTTVDGPVIETTLGYNADYAAPVHEINKNYRNGKTWKYLETPLKEDLPGYEQEIKGAVEGLLK